jgi:glycosyltransferase involved in cell wall biosynthesis
MLNDRPLISVLIPTYNVENFVEEAVNSICIQTYSNLEIIVVDDCSTDMTYIKLLKLAEIDGRIKIYRNDYNRKIAYTLNRAFSLSNGDFIVRMDGDDISMPDKINLQFDYLSKNTNIDLVGSNVYSIDEKGNILNKIKSPTTLEQVEYLMLKYSPVLHIWMCHRSIYERLNGYRELSGSEDYDFLLRMHSMGFKFSNIPEYTYKVRLRNGNTQTTNGLRQILVAEYVKELFFERRRGKIDTFSDVNFFKKTTPNYFMNKLHNVSVKITYMAMKERDQKLYSILLIGLAAILSPYQLKLFLNKLRIKKYLNAN